MIERVHFAPIYPSTIGFWDRVKMKVARPCPVCGEITFSNKCKECGYEFMPVVPKPKVGERGPAKPKTKSVKDKVLKF